VDVQSNLDQMTVAEQLERDRSARAPKAVTRAQQTDLEEISRGYSALEAGERYREPSLNDGPSLQ
jgi:predicted transcriptional regulator